MTAPTVPADVRAAAEAIWNNEMVRTRGKPRSIPWSEVLPDHVARYTDAATAALAAAYAARLAGAGDVVERAVANILQTILDMDDRTSPEDWPEALLVTGEELTNIATEKLADVSALITDLRATIARLVAENSALAANQCGHGYGTETGDHRCRLQDQIVALTAERDAARETALREAEEECREFAHEIFNCFSPEPHEAVETAASRILTLIPTTEGGRDAG